MCKPGCEVCTVTCFSFIEKDMPYNNCATPDKLGAIAQTKFVVYTKASHKRYQKYLFSADGNGFINEIALCCDAGYCYGIVGWIICRIEVDGSASSAIGYCVCIPVNGCARIGEFTCFLFRQFRNEAFQIAGLHDR